MEIEVGDWIRSKDGFIGKVRKITYDDMEKSNYYICEKDNIMASNYLENIAKNSKNIIDLIEVGDYVNGKKVKQIAMFEGFPDYPKLIFTDKKYLIPGETIENKDIKTIVTHEQFERIEYKVEENK